MGKRDLMYMYLKFLQEKKIDDPDFSDEIKAGHHIFQS